MVLILLDTTFVIDYLRGLPEAGAFLDALPDTAPVTVSAFTVLELHEGVAAGRAPAAERRRIEAALGGLTVHALTAAVAERAGVLRGEARLRGERLPFADSIVGATALAHDEPVVTRDRKGFARVPGLRLATY